MAKGFWASAKSGVKNFFKHIGWFLMRRESARDALNGVSRDAMKLARTAAGSNRKPERDEAMRHVKRGRVAYNDGRFEDAENEFREAILSDDTCALAYVYLGHTLYRSGRMNEAVMYWGKAIDVEPGSDAALKAQRKIALVRQRKDHIKEWLEGRLGD